MTSAAQAWRDSLGAELSRQAGGHVEVREPSAWEPGERRGVVLVCDSARTWQRATGLLGEWLTLLEVRIEDGDFWVWLALRPEENDGEVEGREAAAGDRDREDRCGTGDPQRRHSLGRDVDSIDRQTGLRTGGDFRKRRHGKPQQATDFPKPGRPNAAPNARRREPIGDARAGDSHGPLTGGEMREFPSGHSHRPRQARARPAALQGADGAYARADARGPPRGLALETGEGVAGTLFE